MSRSAVDTNYAEQTQHHLPERTDRWTRGKVAFWVGVVVAVIGIIGLVASFVTSGSVRMGLGLSGGACALVGLILMIVGHFSQREERMRGTVISFHEQLLRQQNEAGGAQAEAARAQAMQTKIASLVQAGAIEVTEEQVTANGSENVKEVVNNNRSMYCHFNATPESPGVPKEGDSLELVWMYDVKKRLSFAASMDFYNNHFGSAYVHSNTNPLRESPWNDLIPIRGKISKCNGKLYLELTDVMPRRCCQHSAYDRDQARENIINGLKNPRIRWNK